MFQFYPPLEKVEPNLPLEKVEKNGFAQLFQKLIWINGLAPPLLKVDSKVDLEQ